MVKKHRYLDDIKKICEHNHLTVEEIYNELKKIYPKVWIATVYRAVDFLVSEKILRKIVNINKVAYYETLLEPHAHFIDEDSWKIVDISFDKIWIDESLFDKISDIKIIWKLKEISED